MNGDDDGVLLGQVDPSWMTDGGGISGEQSDPDFSDDTQWPTEAWSRMNDERDDLPPPPPAAGGCIADAGDPPGSGTYILGSIGGICQWISTTTCP
jgi:hypothetical protein